MIGHGPGVFPHSPGFSFSVSLCRNLGWKHPEESTAAAGTNDKRKNRTHSIDKKPDIPDPLKKKIIALKSI
jgi:hypothetical protein